MISICRYKDCISFKGKIQRHPIKCSLWPIIKTFRLKKTIIKKTYVNLNDEKGPRENVRKSYSRMYSESIPAAKISPSGSKVPIGFPSTFIIPEHVGCRRSHNRSDLSSLHDKNTSSTGDIESEVTLAVCPKTQKSQKINLKKKLTRKMSEILIRMQ